MKPLPYPLLPYAVPSICYLNCHSPDFGVGASSPPPPPPSTLAPPSPFRPSGPPLIRMEVPEANGLPVASGAAGLPSVVVAACWPGGGGRAPSAEPGATALGDKTRSTHAKSRTWERIELGGRKGRMGTGSVKAGCVAGVISQVELVFTLFALSRFVLPRFGL